MVEALEDAQPSHSMVEGDSSSSESDSSSSSGSEDNSREERLKAKTAAKRPCDKLRDLFIQIETAFREVIEPNLELMAFVKVEHHQG